MTGVKHTGGNQKCYLFVYLFIYFIGGKGMKCRQGSPCFNGSYGPTFGIMLFISLVGIGLR